MRLCKSLFACILTACALCSCGKIFPGRDPEGEFDRVLIVYMAGFNSLSSSMVRNVEDMAYGYLPPKDSRQAVVLVEHLSETYTYIRGENSSPLVIRLYSGSDGSPVRDTLRNVAADEILVDSEVMGGTLNYIRMLFPSKEYGMLFSSHGSGWLPPGYMENPWYTVPEQDTKSIGQEYYWDDDNRVSREMSLDEFVSAIPFHLDYLIFDSCLMGGVETAYALRDVTDWFVASPAEVLSNGLQYDRLISTVFDNDVENGMKGIAEQYVEWHRTLTWNDCSAIMSVVRTSGLEELAGVCRDLFARYSTAVSNLSYSKVQRYYRYSTTHWFFDLKDILDQAGISSEDAALLRQALDKVVVWKDATDYFMRYSGGFKVERFCGLSSYLPCAGNAALDYYYKNLEWNDATSFVK